MPLRNRILFGFAVLGVVGGLAAAYFYGRKPSAEKPVFNPASNPYARGIYSNGIVESYQTNGANINVYPEVAGTVMKILVSEGQSVKKGMPLFVLDDSVQRATAAQLSSQAQAALSLLQELKAEPRKETLDVSIAQVDAAKASLVNVKDQLAKVLRSYRINRNSVSKNDLDNAVNAVKVARSNLDVAQKQYALTKAGAWIYDIRNQERQYNALTQAAQSAAALLAQYTVRAPQDGVVLAINTAVGSYVAPTTGAYDTYTQGGAPALVMGGSEDELQVRTYVDEILVHRLPAPSEIQAKMFIRGTDISIPLQYTRTQPYVSPKIELSDQRQERVDVRVLPMIFRFTRPKNVNIFPGQLVDVYIGERVAENQPVQLPGQRPSP